MELSPDSAVAVVQQALLLSLLVAAPALAAGLIVGLVVGLLQALTQVQEQTVSFLPKLAATATALLIAAPWMLSQLMEFGRHMIGYATP